MSLTIESARGLPLEERACSISGGMPEFRQKPEGLAMKIADVSRSVFLNICWVAFVYYRLHAITPAAIVPSMLRLLTTLHMIIQSI
jgi:hypothetical protein